MGKQNKGTEFSEFPIPTYEQWRQTTEKALKGRSFETLLTKLIDDIVIEPMYQQKDLEPCSTPLNEPGVFPFLRGNERKPKPWLVSQELTAETPKLFNQVAKHDLARGQNVLHVKLSKEMLIGEKPNFSEDEKGISFIEASDIIDAFAGIDLHEIPLHIDAGVVNLPLLAALQAASDQLEGTVGADPLHLLATDGKLSYSLHSSFEYMKTAVEWAKDKNLRTVLVQTHTYHNGGASSAQELAIALSTGVLYVTELMERGISADDAGKALTFSVSIGQDFFSEIAKIRALRVLWAAIMKEFGAKEESQKMRIHARTSAFTKSKQDPYVNLLRSTGEAFAAAVAGVDSLHVTPLDDAIQSPTTFSRRIARNTSLILQEEAYLALTVDPAGGSWYVEHLTEQFAQKAWDLFKEIECLGGIYEALKEGKIQTWINLTWSKRQSLIENRKQTLVGVNKFVNAKENLPPISGRNKKEQTEYAGKLQKNADATEFLLKKPVTVEGLKELTLQNIPLHLLHEQLKDGSFEDGVSAIEQRRVAEPFERLRDKAKQLKEQSGVSPSVFLLGLGKLAEHKGRMDFSSEFFQSGGFEIQTAAFGDNITAASEAHNSHVIVICGSDQSYEENALTTIKMLLENTNKKVLLAGRPNRDLEEKLIEAGLSGFIHVKSNVYQVLDELLDEMGGSFNE